MKRSTVYLLIDLVLFLGAVGLVLTGLLLKYVLPARSGSAEVWGMTRHEWGDVHFWIAVGLVVLGLVHLLLHVGWLCSVSADVVRARSRKPTRARRCLVGMCIIVFLLVSSVGFLYAASTAKESGSTGRHARLGSQAIETSTHLERDLHDLFYTEQADANHEADRERPRRRGQMRRNLDESES